jgi:hypothetical protein
LIKSSGYHAEAMGVADGCPTLVSYYDSGNVIHLVLVAAILRMCMLNVETSQRHVNPNETSSEYKFF